MPKLFRIQFSSCLRKNLGGEGDRANSSKPITQIYIEIQLKISRLRTERIFSLVLEVSLPWKIGSKICGVTNLGRLVDQKCV
jgi:hypothetical protein